MDINCITIEEATSYVLEYQHRISVKYDISIEELNDLLPSGKDK